MDIGSLLVILALVLVVGAIIARPLFEEQDREMGSTEQRQSVLLAEKEKVLATLQELDLDYAMGKVLSGDYQAQRATLVARGATLLRAMDEMGHTDSLGQRQSAGSMAAQPRSAGASESARDDVEAEIARRRRGKATVGGYCGQCGKPVVAGDRFCSHCGAPLTVEALAR